MLEQNDGQIRQLSAHEVREVRHTVLQFAESSDASVLPGDDEAATLHLGFFVNQDLVGVASLYREEIAERAGGYRLRAVAVRQSMQRRGVGTALIKTALSAASGAGAHYIWCTVRSSTIQFYEQFGFHDDGTKIEMPHGTFSRMVLNIT